MTRPRRPRPSTRAAGTTAVTSATVGADGRLRYLGRLKDMLKVGGENVAAIEIASHLQAHPAVSVAQVVGVADEKYGEVAAAFIELSPGAVADRGGGHRALPGRAGQLQGAAARAVRHRVADVLHQGADLPAARATRGRTGRPHWRLRPARGCARLTAHATSAISGCRCATTSAACGSTRTTSASTRRRRRSTPTAPSSSATRTGSTSRYTRSRTSRRCPRSCTPGSGPPSRRGPHAACPPGRRRRHGHRAGRRGRLHIVQMP